ncbi:DUF998 domain-containing protein [Lentzea kentuckyensis]|uniref:DUF998 domain-containing protein n=1 Tax=Lentzea kentuckyensis TaxID=360086 RepID=UPI000A391D36|nr:DUF998 domain-containing protein [Lentzea kentuckyensis]
MTNPKPGSRVLLASGIAAGALIEVVLWADGATRTGYSLWHHGASQLGTGDRAWLQTANFVLGGLLLAAFAFGLRRTSKSGPGATWGPRLLATAAAGLVLAGLVPTDPALGYPPGQQATESPPAALSIRWRAWRCSPGSARRPSSWLDDWARPAETGRSTPACPAPSS